MIVDCYRFCLRGFLALYLGLVRIAAFFTRPRRLVGEQGYEVLLTGTFYSANWLQPHLQPLAGAKNCRRVRMVANAPVPDLPKVEPVYPPQWLCRVVGQVPARLLLFSWLALKDRPHFIGGFHLLLNGLLAILLARIIGSRSFYICGGGEREVLGGGYQTENRMFRRIGKADQVIERQLIAAVRLCDLIITMGNGARLFFHRQGVPLTSLHVMPGGYDSERFHPGNGEKKFDLVTVGRLSSVKRVDLILETMALLRKDLPALSVLIVGDGPERLALEQHALRLNLERQVVFVGHQDAVEDYLRQARIFLLCSDSEGVSQAMIQAMLCGLPAVVSDVGDLGDVACDGVNGFLVTDRTPAGFGAALLPLLSRSERLEAMSRAARIAAEHHSVSNASLKWEVLFDESVVGVRGETIEV